MSKKTLVALCVITLVFTINACATTTEAPLPTPTTPTTGTRPKGTSTPLSGPIIYKVTRETGLYSDPNANAEQITILSTGTKVKPAEGTTLICKSFTDSGMTITVCHIKVISTLQEGWVLRKTLQKQ